MTKKFKELLERAETWPEEAQQDLFAVAQEIEAGQRFYDASSEELKGIDRGLAAAEQGLFATAEEMKEFVAKFHA